MSGIMFLPESMQGLDRRTKSIIKFGQYETDNPRVETVSQLIFSFCRKLITRYQIVWYRDRKYDLPQDVRQLIQTLNNDQKIQAENW